MAFLYTHRFNLEDGFVTFARVARLSSLHGTLLGSFSMISGACINRRKLVKPILVGGLLSWSTFSYTHRFNLAYGFVTFARFARLFFFNDSPRKLLLISDAGINNGSLSSYWASSSISRSALLSLPLSLLTPEL